jgi:branched-chain amino acid transport system ATP-binding protein
VTGPVLEVDGLTVHYGGVAALDDVTFSVETGQIVGLIGPNGAGKTTCIDALTGFVTPTRGEVSFAGRPLGSAPPHERARRGFVRTFQSLELFDDLSVRDNLAVAASTPTWRSTLTDALRPKARGSDVVDEVLALLDLASHADRLPSELSNGQRHHVALGRALVARPSLVLLDEPAAGLDSSETAELGRLISVLPDRGTSVLLVDHDMPLVLGTCHHLLVLDFGRLVATGPPEQVRADPSVIAAYLGSSSEGAR